MFSVPRVGVAGGVSEGTFVLSFRSLVDGV